MSVCSISAERDGPVIMFTVRGITLTDAGRVLLTTADAIHAELQIAAQQLRALQAGGPQALTVVTFPSAGEPLLAPALTALTVSGQPVEVTVIEAEPEQALGSIRDGQADLARVYHVHTPARPSRSCAPLPLPHRCDAARLAGRRRSWPLHPARR